MLTAAWRSRRAAQPLLKEMAFDRCKAGQDVFVMLPNMSLHNCLLSKALAVSSLSAGSWLRDRRKVGRMCGYV
jgi:hypothetical protein